MEIKFSVDLLAPFAHAVTFLEGEQYATSSSVIPILFTLKEHLSKPDSAEPILLYQNVHPELLTVFEERFKRFYYPGANGFDPTYLIATLLHPSKTLQIDEELFDYGKACLKAYATDFARQKDLEKKVKL